MGRITSFRELDVYQEAFRLAMEIFRLTRTLPSEERFELVPQIRRSSRSACANTAEAWRRRRYPAAFIAKLNDVETEAAETRVHLDFALACGYLEREWYRELDLAYDALIGRVVRMIDSADSWTIGRSESGQEVHAGSSE